MSYVVLARKYRPMRFADMVGQEHIGRTLGNAIKQDRVHHAYLFSGARGLGKTTTARIFAKGLVCQEGPTPEPCNVCSECVAVSEGRSVDVMEIDGASNNSVDNIRGLREQVNYLPQTARRKVYIIDEVHMLTTSAFNALLKTLEEPPAHVNFVFATTEPQKVLPTILSRVNRLDFKRVAPGLLVSYLRSILDKEGLSVEEGGLRIVARAGGGSVRDALTLLDQVIAFAEDPSAVGEDEVRRLLGQADATAVLDLLGAVLRRDPTETIQRFDALVTAGNDLSVLCFQVLEHLRDLTLVKVCNTPKVLPDATEAEMEQRRALVTDVSATHLGQLFDRFSRVIDRLPQSRTQRLLVEMGLLDLACAEPVMPLGDLVEQLHALGSGAAPAGGTGGGRGGQRAPSSGRGRPRGGGGMRAQAPESDGFVPPSMPSFDAGPPPRPEPPQRPAPQSETPSFDAGPPPRPEPPRRPAPQPETPSFDAGPPPRPEPPRRPAPQPEAPSFDAGPPPRPEPPRRPAPQPEAPSFDAGPPPRPEPPRRPAPQPETPSFGAGPPSRPEPRRSFDAGPPPRPEPPPFDAGPPPRPEPSRGEPRAPQPESPAAHASAPPPAPERSAPPAADANSFTAKLLSMGYAGGMVISEEEAAEEVAAGRRPPSTPPAPGPTSTAPEGPRPPAASAQGAPEIRMGAGPCQPPAPAAGVIEWEELPTIEAWEQLVGRIRQSDDFLAAAVLGEVGLVALADGVLRVAAPRSSFAYKHLSQPQKRAEVEQFARDHLGAPFTMELAEGMPALPDLPSLGLLAQKRRAEHRAAVEAEARAHPGITALLQAFDATLVSTKPLQEP